MWNQLKSDLKSYGGDWSCQGFWAMTVYRFGQARYNIRPAILRKPFSLVYKILYKGVQILTGIELPCEVPIGEGLRIDHFGGIVVSGYARIGTNCTLRNGVTIGIRKVGETKAPNIGDHVDIGTGAKILGDIRIGNHVTIGANAVVLQDIPDHCIAVGIPARIIYPNPAKGTENKKVEYDYPYSITL